MHELDEDGEHDPDECGACIERQHSVDCDCRCGDCCRNLILEADLRDAAREPRIARECRPIKGFGDEVEGYSLNDRSNGLACHFLNAQTNLCEIHNTRPLMCRVFNCDQARSNPDHPLFAPE